jgi:hypothetical protein
MSEPSLNLTRRELISVSSAAIASTLLLNLAGKKPEAKAAETKEAAKNDINYANPKCKGCQVCKIYYSNCLALNNRLCWCEPAESDRPAAET